MNYFILRSILEKYILEIERLNCLTSNFLSFDFDLERSFYCAIRKPVLHIYLLLTFFLLLLFFEDTWLWSFKILTLTFNLQGSSEVKNISAIRKFIHHFLSNFHRHFLSISYRFREIRLRSFQSLTLTFDPERSSGVKNSFTIRKFILHFLSNFYRHFLPISYRFRDFRLQSF